MSAVATPRPCEVDAQMRLDDDGGPAVVRPPAPEATALPPRQCGRCRQLFPGDSTRPPGALTEWWLCPACRTALLGVVPPARRPVAGEAPRIVGADRPRRVTSTPARAPERAELVWQRALQLARPPARRDRFDNALDLLRAAHHDPATMSHALTLGRTQLRSNAGDEIARTASHILAAAIEFLGVKPNQGDVRRPARPIKRSRQTHRAARRSPC